MATPIVKEAVPQPGLMQTGWIRRLVGHIPPQQFRRYLVVGTWNTAFGYGDYAVWTAVLTPMIAHGYIYASILSTPLNITVSYLGYKWFVFKTQGNYLREWLRCLLVYGSKSVIGIALLPGVVLLVRWTTGLGTAAPYIGGAIMMGFGLIYSFFGHKHYSFRTPR